MSGDILTVEADVYHSDQIGDQPCLSASIAKILVAESPAHAYAAHPKLNPAWAPTDEKKFDLGKVVHQLLLDEHTSVEVVHYENWTTKDAKLCAEVARAAGKTPLLAKDWARATEIADAIREQVAGLDVAPPILTDGKSEQTLVWNEDGVACKARLDWLRDDRLAIDDVKTTSRSASPEQFSRSLFGLGYDVQAAMYQRAVLALTGEVAEFRFIVAETKPPYAVSVVALSPGSLMLANKKLDYALDAWARCLREDSWPGYPTEVCYAETPSWLEAQWLERELEEAQA